MTLARALAPGRFWGAGLDTCCKISSRHIVEGSAPAKHRWAVYHILAMGGGERTHAACISDVSVRCVYVCGRLERRSRLRRVVLDASLRAHATARAQDIPDAGSRGARRSPWGGGFCGRWGDDPPPDARGGDAFLPRSGRGKAHGQKMPWRVTRNGGTQGPARGREHYDCALDVDGDVGYDDSGARGGRVSSIHRRGFFSTTRGAALLLPPIPSVLSGSASA